jgi:hypothetical protein
MVTGRRIKDLLAACSCTNLFDLIVAENGVGTYEPSTRNELVLGNPSRKPSCKHCANAR